MPFSLVCVTYMATNSKESSTRRGSGRHIFGRLILCNKVIFNNFYVAPVSCMEKIVNYKHIADMALRVHMLLI